MLYQWRAANKMPMVSWLDRKTLEPIMRISSPLDKHQAATWHVAVKTRPVWMAEHQPANDAAVLFEDEHGWVEIVLKI